MIHFLTHDAADDVGVAVVDIQAGLDCTGRNLADNRTLAAKATEDIPLGHKLALREFAVGDPVTKYGCVIGTVVKPIKPGQWVHIHNLKTKRWA